MTMIPVLRDSESLEEEYDVADNLDPEELENLESGGSKKRRKHKKRVKQRKKLERLVMERDMLLKKLEILQMQKKEEEEAETVEADEQAEKVAEPQPVVVTDLPEVDSERSVEPQQSVVSPEEPNPEDERKLIRKIETVEPEFDIGEVAKSGSNSGSYLQYQQSQNLTAELFEPKNEELDSSLEKTEVKMEPETEIEVLVTTPEPVKTTKSPETLLDFMKKEHHDRYEELKHIRQIDAIKAKAEVERKCVDKSFVCKNIYAFCDSEKYQIMCCDTCRRYQLSQAMLENEKRGIEANGMVLDLPDTAGPIGEVHFPKIGLPEVDVEVVEVSTVEMAVKLVEDDGAEVNFESEELEPQDEATVTEASQIENQEEAT